MIPLFQKQKLYLPQQQSFEILTTIFQKYSTP